LRQLQSADQDLRLETLSNPRLAGLAGLLRAAGLNFTALEWRLGQLGLGLLAAGLSWALGLSGLPALWLGLLAAAAPALWLRQHQAGRIQRLEAQLPLALAQIAAGIQASQGLLPMLQGLSEALARSGATELAAEFQALATALRRGAAQEALSQWGQTSASISLSHLASLLASYEQRGGGQYGEAMAAAARQMRSLVALRQHARAKAAQALQAARIMPLLLLGVLLILLADPVVAQAFRTPLAQIAVSLALGVMLLGYLLMQAEVRKVL
jgi:tight adherence protein B